MVKKIVTRIISIGLCAMIMAVSGCRRAQDAEPETQTQRETTEQVKKIESSIDKSYNAGMKWTELSHKFVSKGGDRRTGSKSKNYYTYGREIIYTGDLIEDEGIKSIEYSLSNCVGSFMDDSYYQNKDDKPGAMILKLENKPYLLEGSDQSGIYFVVYYYYRDPSRTDYKLQASQAQECMKYLRITADITFEDGKKKTRRYGIEFTSETYYDAKHMKIYQLE